MKEKEQKRWPTNSIKRLVKLLDLVGHHLNIRSEKRLGVSKVAEYHSSELNVSKSKHDSHCEVGSVNLKRVTTI